MSSSDVFELKGNTALYEVLGVAKDASEKDIRRAYYKLAVLYHPDKNPNGEEIFKEICFAYNILSDSEQRSMYDRQTLRNNLQGRAKEYDPTMDPNVELSPEDLRKFVERVREAQRSKQKNISDFERRREEEMQRRAEWDAKHPGFKEEYEAKRALRRQGRSTTSSSPTADEANAMVTAPKFRTSYELVADLHKEEEKRLLGIRTAAPAKKAATLPEIKASMLRQYRSEQDFSKNSGIVKKRETTSSNLSFVREHEEVPSYSSTIDEKMREHSNFDYLKFVENDMVDGGVMEGAILADALGNYDRHN